MTNIQIQENLAGISGIGSSKMAFGSSFQSVISMIKAYQLQMGRPVKDGHENTHEEKCEHHRLNVLALIAEAVEVLDAAPWKPWKNYKEEEVSRAHMAEELADCIFFITALATTWDITPARLEQAIMNKIEENQRRIASGYSKTL